MSSNRIVWLFSPGNMENFVLEGRETNADVLVPDLEDAIDKSGDEQRLVEGRNLIAEMATSYDWEEQELYPRINSYSSSHWKGDLESLAPATPSGVIIPKVESAGDILEIAQYLGDLEDEYGIEENRLGLSCMIETARGFVNIDDIATCHDRIEGLLLGPGDLSTSFGALRDDVERLAAVHSILDYPRMKISISASAAGIESIGGPPIMGKQGDDMAEYMVDHSFRSARMGFSGKISMLPQHVEYIRQGFAPSREEVDRAQNILREYRDMIDAEERREIDLHREHVWVKYSEIVLERYEALGVKEDYSI